MADTYGTIFDEMNMTTVDLSSTSVIDSSGNSSANLTTVLLRNKQYILWVMNERVYYNRFLPATIYIGVCAVLGTAGNGIVVCVYNTQRKRNTANVFIFFLSVMDLLLCCTVMPFKLFDMRYPLMYGIAPLCTCYHFLEITLSMVAVTFMICIAVDRYLIIARPLHRMTLRKIYKIIGVCIVIGIAASWPTVFIYGKTTVKTSTPGIVGDTCGLSDVMKGKVITQVWFLYLYTVFVVTLVVLIIMYIKIWLLIRKWKHTLIGESATCFTPKYKPVSRRFHEPIPLGDDDDKYVKMNSYIPMRTLNLPPRSRKLSFDDEDDVFSLHDFDADLLESSTGSTNSHTTLLSKSKWLRVFPRNRRRSSAGAASIDSTGRKRARMRRNTIVFGVISLLFVLSYLPCLVVIGLRTLELYNVTKTSQLNARVAEVFIRSGYLSSVLNPYVYSFLCPNFRKGVRQLFFR